MKKLNVDALKTIFGGARETNDPRFPHCFAEDTHLTTNNGQKRIKDLDINKDRVWNPMNRQWMKVAKKRASIHKGNALTISTNRGTVVVTDSHAFMLLNGEVVKANELHKGDLLADGASGDMITNISPYKVKDYMIVHNLVFHTKNADHDANHFVEANGVVAGLLYLQDKIAHRVPVHSETNYA